MINNIWLTMLLLGQVCCDGGRTEATPKETISIREITSGGWVLNAHEYSVRIKIETVLPVDRPDNKFIIIDRQVKTPDSKCFFESTKLPIATDTVSTYKLHSFFKQGMEFVYIAEPKLQKSVPCQNIKSTIPITQEMIYDIGHQPRSIKGNHEAIANNLGQDTPMNVLFLSHGSYDLFLVDGSESQIQPVINFKESTVRGIVLPVALIREDRRWMNYTLSNMDLSQSLASFYPFGAVLDPDLAFLRCVSLNYGSNDRQVYPDYMVFFMKGVKAIETRNFDYLYHFERESGCLKLL